MMNTPRRWLTSLESQSLGDFDLTPELDLSVSALALLAKQDAHARQELFVLLATKVARFSNRFRRWSGSVWEYDDLLQETYVAFDDVLESWRPLEGNGPPAGFAYYFLGVYAGRLQDRVVSLTGPRWTRRTASLVDRDVDTIAASDDVELSATASALLEQICGRLNAADAAILRHRAAGLEFETEQLRSSGITASRRTVYRRWKNIVSIAREVHGEQRAAG